MTKEDKPINPTKKPKSVWIWFAIAVVIAAAVGFGLGRRNQTTENRPVNSGITEHAHEHTDEQTLYTCGMHPWIISKEPGLCPICNMKLTPKRDDAGTSSARDAAERKVSYWRAPMNPTEIYDKPGKSAMGMDLVPVYEDEVIGGVAITVDPVIRQNMGIRTAPVESGPLTYTIRTYGHITYDETRLTEISPRFGGWLEKLYIDFTGQYVNKGEPLFAIYSPEILTAQEEYLVALKNSRGRSGQAMADAVKRRLLFFGVSEPEIDAIGKSMKTRRNITIFSPFSGIVVHKNALLGGYVKEGTALYRIADLSRVWVEAHIYEYELAHVRKGLEAEMSLPYHPGTTFTGKVTYVYPYLQKQTRDVVIRLELDNPDLLLKPEMYADVRIRTQGESRGTLIPEEAVIRSGERNVVFVAGADGKFIPRMVTLGMKVDNGKIQALSGIAPGETIVTSGQFLLDSESRLKEAVQKMLAVQKLPGQSSVAEKKADDFFDDMKMEDDFFKEMDSDD